MTQPGPQVTADEDGHPVVTVFPAPAVAGTPPPAAGAAEQED